MSTGTLGYPAHVRGILESRLKHLGVWGVSVTPRDERGRKCAVWQADCYEVKARLVSTPLPGELDPVEAALKDYPGVCRTARELSAEPGDPLTGAGALPARVSDPDWPLPWNPERNLHCWTTPGVLAIMRDPAS